MFYPWLVKYDSNSAIFKKDQAVILPARINVAMPPVFQLYALYTNAG